MSHPSDLEAMIRAIVREELARVQADAALNREPTTIRLAESGELTTHAVLAPFYARIEIVPMSSLPLESRQNA